VADLSHRDNHFAITDLINDSIVSLANAVVLESGKLDTSGWARFVPQAFHPNQDLLQVLFRYLLDILPYRRTNPKVIIGHGL